MGVAEVKVNLRGLLAADGSALRINHHELLGERGGVRHAEVRAACTFCPAWKAALRATKVLPRAMVSPVGPVSVMNGLRAIGFPAGGHTAEAALIGRGPGLELDGGSCGSGCLRLGLRGGCGRTWPRRKRRGQRCEESCDGDARSFVSILRRSMVHLARARTAGEQRGSAVRLEEIITPAATGGQTKVGDNAGLGGGFGSRCAGAVVAGGLPPSGTGCQHVPEIRHLRRIRRTFLWRNREALGYAGDPAILAHPHLGDDDFGKLFGDLLKSFVATIPPTMRAGWFADAGGADDLRLQRGQSVDQMIVLSGPFRLAGVAGAAAERLPVRKKSLAAVPPRAIQAPASRRRFCVLRARARALLAVAAGRGWRSGDCRRLRQVVPPRGHFRRVVCRMRRPGHKDVVVLLEAEPIGLRRLLSGMVESPRSRCR